MKKIFASVALMGLVCLSACAQIGGNSGLAGTSGVGAASVATPVISSLALSPSPTSIVATFTTPSAGDTQFNCGTTLGSYTIPAVDNGVETSVYSHEAIVAGLTPGLTYYCQVTSTNGVGTGAALATSTTLSAPTSTPITGITVGTPVAYNSLNPNNKSIADGFYHMKCGNGITYLGNGDAEVNNFTVSGVPAVTSSNLQMNQVISESPLVIQQVNPMTGFGTFASGNGDDGHSPKISGIWCQQNILYMFTGRQEDGPGGDPPTAPGAPQYSPNVSQSLDHGLTWNNSQSPGVFTTTASMLTPASTSILGTTTASTWGSETPVMYGADDGTIGYLNSANRIDNADAYVYMMSNDGCAIGGERLYLARIPRAKLGQLNGANWQYFTGGDGNLNANWSSTESAAYSMVTELGDAPLSCAGTLGQQSVQYFPARNRYLLTAYYWPGGFQVAHTNASWPVYEAPHPWGPWTLVTTFNWPTAGYYNPVMANWTVSGNSVTVMATGDYTTCCGGPNDIYNMYLFNFTLTP